MLFWIDQKIHLAFYNGCLWKNKFWSIKKWRRHIPKIILHNYILYKGDPTYIGTFPVNLRMALIFTDLPTGSGSAPCAVLEICKYQRHPWVHWEITFKPLIQYITIFTCSFISFITLITSSSNITNFIFVSENFNFIKIT